MGRAPNSPRSMQSLSLTFRIWKRAPPRRGPRLLDLHLKVPDLVVPVGVVADGLLDGAVDLALLTPGEFGALPVVALRSRTFSAGTTGFFFAGFLASPPPPPPPSPLPPPPSPLGSSEGRLLGAFGPRAPTRPRSARSPDSRSDWAPAHCPPARSDPWHSCGPAACTRSRSSRTRSSTPARCRRTPPASRAGTHAGHTSPRPPSARPPTGAPPARYGRSSFDPNQMICRGFSVVSTMPPGPADTAHSPAGSRTTDDPGITPGNRRRHLRITEIVHRQPRPPPEPPLHRPAAPTPPAPR